MRSSEFVAPSVSELAGIAVAGVTTADRSVTFRSWRAAGKWSSSPCPSPPQPSISRWIDGAPIRVVRHGNPSGPRVVLSHGNGFASDSYFPFWRLMLERFDLALFDLRNCGRNPFHAAEPHDYARFQLAATLRCMARSLSSGAARQRLSVFHSTSAIANRARGGRRRLALGCAGAVRSAGGPAGREPAARPADDGGQGAARRCPDSREPVPGSRAAGRLVPSAAPLPPPAERCRRNSTRARCCVSMPRAANGCSVVPATVEAGLYVEVEGQPIWSEAGPT